MQGTVKFGGLIEENGAFRPTISMDIDGRTVEFTANVTVSEEDIGPFCEIVYMILSGPQANTQKDPSGNLFPEAH